jgi:anti-sigma28 factor (negative regulator of flagellin synthesis)
MIIYLVYAIILSVHRRSVILIPEEINNGGYKMDNNEVVNPDMDNYNYGVDEAEL